DPTELREALQAMPFLADRRVVVVTDAQTLRAPDREALAGVARDVPEGNTLILTDLVKPLARSPVPLGRLVGRDALRIDTTVENAPNARARFVTETLERLGVTADKRVVDELARSQSELAAVRNDLEKLALSHKKITLKDLLAEALAAEDPKAYEYASAAVEGQVPRALAVAHESFANDPRGAGVRLLWQLATECRYVWALTRNLDELPPNLAWRKRMLAPLARRIGERRARGAYEKAVRAMESIVTGGAGNDPDEVRTFVDRITVEFSRLKS
ncbi:MAG: hypothetical protein JO263_11640, partial [Candidatus Eremiobacteraeota bacterium]|nr:hypothetical protein [Candidatus Eremiobacteraeota bacterium]